MFMALYTRHGMKPLTRVTIYVQWTGCWATTVMMAHSGFWVNCITDGVKLMYSRVQSDRLAVSIVSFEECHISLTEYELIRINDSSKTVKQTGID